MPSLRSLRDLLGGEREIEKALRDHASLALRAAQGIQPVFSRVAADDHDGARVAYHEVDRLETEADDAHRKIVEAVSSGVFFSGIGVDIMNLAEKIDDIADNAKDASRVLVLRRLRGLEVAGVSEMIDSYLAACVKATSSLRLAVDALATGKGEVVRHVTETERSEEAADEVKDGLIAKIYDLQIPVLSIIQLKDFVLLADNVADHAEDAGDQLLILLSKGYT